MTTLKTLMTIDPQIRDGYLMIPKGMTPIYLHHLRGDRMIAYVEGWKPELEFAGQKFDLYLLSDARQFIVPLAHNGSTENQRWYDTFGKPAKEATLINGELVI